MGARGCDEDAPIGIVEEADARPDGPVPDGGPPAPPGLTHIWINASRTALVTGSAESSFPQISVYLYDQEEDPWRSLPAAPAADPPGLRERFGSCSVVGESEEGTLPPIIPRIASDAGVVRVAFNGGPMQVARGGSGTNGSGPYYEIFGAAVPADGLVRATVEVTLPDRPVIHQEVDVPIMEVQQPQVEVGGPGGNIRTMRYQVGRDLDIAWTVPSSTGQQTRTVFWQGAESSPGLPEHVLVCHDEGSGDAPYALTIPWRVIEDYALLRGCEPSVCSHYFGEPPNFNVGGYDIHAVSGVRVLTSWGSHFRVSTIEATE